jgi:excinuclease ABC subunit C
MNCFNHKDFLKQTPVNSGVYFMKNKNDKIIYIGKAKNLKNRLSSYFRENKNKKTLNLVKNISKIDFIITNNEVEALILESNLIKKHLPRYNVLLKDDKTYPYIHISDDKNPRLSYQRGNKRLAGHYFGPYPNQNAAKNAIQLVQKTFKLRDCDNTTFSNRTRPCLSHQIGKCSAPCVKGHISDENYMASINEATLLLNGKSKELRTKLVSEMDNASSELNFELAGKIRDKIKLINILSKEQLSDTKKSNTDVVFITKKYGFCAVNILFLRNGVIIGNNKHTININNMDNTEEEVKSNFIKQYYLLKNVAEIPKTIIINGEFDEIETIKKSFLLTFEKSPNFITNPRVENLELLKLSEKNATNYINQIINNKLDISAKIKSLELDLSIEKINRIECFDISHLSGEGTVGSCVCFNRDGISYKDYRRYNIEGITGGDDYEAMRIALTKRYKKKENTPELIMIDGGKGQLKIANEVINSIYECELIKPSIIGISKGVTRKHGDEIIYDNKMNILNIERDGLSRFLIWQIRDESHSYALTGSRKKVLKNKIKSSLEDIDGVGAKKKKSLIMHFGGLIEIKKASVKELMSVEGINKKIAEKIFDYYN